MTKDRWNREEQNAIRNAETRCRCVMSNTDEGGIDELLKRKAKLLERNYIKYAYMGSLQGLYDAKEVEEIDRLVEINSINNSLNK